jgi:hypothetical protein
MYSNLYLNACSDCLVMAEKLDNFAYKLQQYYTNFTDYEKIKTIIGNESINTLNTKFHKKILDKMQKLFEILNKSTFFYLTPRRPCKIFATTTLKTKKSIYDYFEKIDNLLNSIIFLVNQEETDSDYEESIPNDGETQSEFSSDSSGLEGYESEYSTANGYNPNVKFDEPYYQNIIPIIQLFIPPENWQTQTIELCNKINVLFEDNNFYEFYEGKVNFLKTQSFFQKNISVYLKMLANIFSIFSKSKELGLCRFYKDHRKEAKISEILEIISQKFSLSSNIYLDNIQKIEKMKIQIIQKEIENIYGKNDHLFLTTQSGNKVGFIIGDEAYNLFAETNDGNFEFLTYDSDDLIKTPVEIDEQTNLIISPEQFTGSFKPQFAYISLESVINEINKNLFKSREIIEKIDKQVKNP